jgi:Zn-dependent protease
MLRFQLFGIPCVVAPYFWILSAILGSNIARGGGYGLLLLAVWVACVFVSILVHELGHAFAAQHYGSRPAIALAGLGGLTSFQGRGLTRRQHIAVSLAGPAAGLLLYMVVRELARRLLPLGLGALPGAGTGLSLVLYQALAYLLFINLYWTIYNLIPVLPLDGGQVLRDVLGPRFIGTVRIIGAICAVAVAFYAARVGQLYMALLFGYLAYANFSGDTGRLPGGVDRSGY